MSIDWLSFLVVAAATLLAAVVVVGLFSFGIRLLAVAADPLVTRQPAARLAAYACFALCSLAVLYGVYLIVPVFH